MTETVLYERLKNYNNTIDNQYKDKWGSLVTYLPGKDTQHLSKMVVNTTLDVEKFRQDFSHKLTKRFASLEAVWMKHTQYGWKDKKSSRPNMLQKIRDGHISVQMPELRPPVIKASVQH